MQEQQNILPNENSPIHSCNWQLTGNGMPGVYGNSRFDVFGGKIYPNLRPWIDVRC